MNNKKWQSLLKTAKDYDVACFVAVEKFGKEAFETLRNQVTLLYPSNAKMTDLEWVVAVWRYRSFLGKHQFDEGDRDKLLMLAFVLRWGRDRVTERIQAAQVGSTGVVSEDIDSGHAFIQSLKEALGECIAVHRSSFDALSREKVSTAGLLNKTRMKTLKPIEAAMKVLMAEHEQLTEFRALLSSRTSEVSEINPKQLDSWQKTLADTNKQITAIEGELSLNTQHGDDSVASTIDGIFAKVRRYRQENPQEFEWSCPECEWSGQLEKRRASDDMIINQMAKAWVRKCPSCGHIIAYDIKHPYFDGKIVFSHRLWERVVEGTVSLVDAAYILEVSQEHFIDVVPRVFKQEIPEHVQRQFIEWQGFEVASDYDEEVSDIVSNESELEE